MVSCNFNWNDVQRISNPFRFGQKFDWWGSNRSITVVATYFCAARLLMLLLLVKRTWSFVDAFIIHFHFFTSLFSTQLKAGSVSPVSCDRKILFHCCYLARFKWLGKYVYSVHFSLYMYIYIDDQPNEHSDLIISFMHYIAIDYTLCIRWCLLLTRN